MARCELPSGRECLWDHIRLKARAAGLKPQPNTAGTSLSLLCPVHVHADTKPSLTISVAAAEGKRIVWRCHAGCPEMAVRDALIADCHISPGCLPVSRAETAALLDAVVGELTRPTRNHAQKVVIALAIALGYKEVPHGDELERLAARASVGRRSAYKARGRQPDNP